MTKIFYLLLWSLPWALYSRQVDTFYGPLEIEEPVLLELIDHPAFQRLKNIHQYGVSYYTTHREEYNRYDHSMGVFAFLRTKGCSLEEQIAGLLHDVSHTVFSHVGDWIFGKENKDEDYQSTVHARFLQQSGLGDVLEKYHFTIEQILPSEKRHPALECPLPNLCADRLDYDTQGAYYQCFVTHEEAIRIFNDIQFIDNQWISTLPELMKKVSLFSFFMTEHCWGSPTNYFASRCLANAILRGIDLGDITYDEVHFSTDQAIWDKLTMSTDPTIQQHMDMVLHPEAYFTQTDRHGADWLIKGKFRGINPWILTGSNLSRLTEIDSEIGEKFTTVKTTVEHGWAIKLLSQ